MRAASLKKDMLRGNYATRIDMCAEKGVATVQTQAHYLASLTATANGERGALCAKAISIDHKPGNPDERERIMQGGGCVAPSRTLMGRAAGPLRVWDSSRQAGLATSRSFGDMGYRVNGTGGVISEPQMHVFEITSEARFVVIGSDGLWDQLSPAEAVSLASHFSSRGADYAAEELVEAALGRWRRVGRFHDDITAVVVKLPAPRASA
mmetsp:Transcript_38048/g.79988  ORF Transcript_38048/g.79988 Transcript_38048/m.79988 type:complete len:208 (-) Transcript_38048:521-1144(-)